MRNKRTKASNVINLMESIINGIEWQKKTGLDFTEVEVSDGDKIQFCYNNKKHTLLIEHNFGRIEVLCPNERTGKSIVSNFEEDFRDCCFFEDTLDLINEICDQDHTLSVTHHEGSIYGKGRQGK